MTSKEERGQNNAKHCIYFQIHYSREQRVDGCRQIGEKGRWQCLSRVRLWKELEILQAVHIELVKVKDAYNGSGQTSAGHHVEFADS